MRRTKLPLDKLSKLDKERVLKKEIGEQTEKLEAMGQESDRKAAKWVKEVGKEERKKEQDRQDVVMEILDKSKKHILTYKEQLMKEMIHEMKYWDDDLPTGYNWAPQSTDKGIVLWIRNPKKEYFAKGIKLSGEPKYDLNAIARIIVGAVKEMEKQSTPVTQGGIILPN